MIHKEQRQLIKNNLSLIFPQNQVIEVRILDSGKGTVSGYFDDFSLIPDKIKGYNSTANIYMTLNPIDERLIARGKNKLKSYVKSTTTVKDITNVKYILVDVDAERPEGISATDKEKANAYDVVVEIKKYLKKKSFTNIVVADSGNSYHLLVSVNLKNTTANAQLVKDFLTALNNMFSTDKAFVDIPTNNPQVLTRLYGTKNCKGEDMDDRPHRNSSIIEIQ